jgi:hypothetical protein
LLAVAAVVVLNHLTAPEAAAVAVAQADILLVQHLLLKADHMQ